MAPIARGARKQEPLLGHLPPLRALSTSLLELTALAQKVAPQQMLHEALQLLQRLVPFDSAWWGEVSAGNAQAAPRNWLHGSIGLSQQFAQEWNALAAVDDFARLSMDRLGEVICENGPDAPGAIPPEMEAFSRRHGLFHCMAITVELPASGLMFFVSIYRKPQGLPFGSVEAELFGEFVPHLLCHWHHALHRLQALPASHPWDHHALAEPDGNLLYVGLRLGQALQQADPHWSGPALPADVCAGLRKLPCSVAVGKNARLRLEACGPLVLISLAARQQGGSHMPLAPRELGAATLYAHGHSYKDIASALGLSPATVRTYLRSAYTLLGVRNKVELVSALRK
ncbi:helix-turn-helix transcriptional regulator [Acidovorax sp. DW039]|uniref:helix-turn-helix transcriptional regulator n=1 Tax=Acidovorax sp. DW039 TaxID=3095606 RepID=UPI003089ECC7|nr:helix-turn-helix transcriptional regulator [Acidovorax sp. DW039]